jgi:uncharacterized protein
MRTGSRIRCSWGEPMKSFYGTAISENLAMTPEGFLICRNVIVSRTAVKTPQVYKESEIRNGGSDIRVPVWRPHSSVFDPACVASHEGKPICSPHPPQFLTPQNISTYQKGVCMNCRPGPTVDGEETLMCDLVITDAQLIEDILSKRLREVSIGYECAYLPEESGDGFTQTNIVANHCAIVQNARAGPFARIYDADGEQPMSDVLAQYHERHAPPITIGSLMRKMSQTLARIAARSPEDEAMCVDFINDLTREELARVGRQVQDTAPDRAVEYAELCKRFHRRATQ